MSAEPNTTPTPSGPDLDYPEQLHAGKVGYGPRYREGATMMDKISGMSEEIHGKLARKPELVKEGREKKTGELRKKQLRLDEENPFSAGQDEPESKSGDQTRSSASASRGSPPSQSSSGARPSGSPERTSSRTGAYASGTGAREEAATVDPPADSETETATSRLAQAKSQGVKSLSEAQENS